jgi:hypothetical protein
MNPDAAPATAVGIAFPLPHELSTVNVYLLVSVVAPVVMVTKPLLAPAGTVAVRKVVPVSVTLRAATPLNFTTDGELNPWPRIPI